MRPVGLLLLLTIAASAKAANLQAEFQELTKNFDGRAGICTQTRQTTTCINPDQRFSLQSVMKLLVAASAMDALHLDEPITVHKQDLSLYVQPIAKLVTEEGYKTTIGDLIRRAVVDSDSAATDILVAKLGGPKAVQSFLTKKGITGLRIDRDEKHLQTEISGLQWKPEFVDPAVLDKAIADLPEAQKAAAYSKYQTDARDTSTPKAMANFLFALAEGKLLNPTATKHLLEVMTQTVTFPDRLKAGVSGNWTIAHKTGTSGSWKGVTAATNDVGILTAPDGKSHVAIVVFIGDCREPLVKRAALMAAAAKLTIANQR